MIATESTFSRLLLGIEPMFLVEIYPLCCTRLQPLASRKGLVHVRDIESINDTKWNKPGDTDGAITPSLSNACRLRKSPNDML